MLFSRYLRGSAKPGSSYRPEVGVLEDRVVPTALRGFGPVVPPNSVATHLLVIVPPNVQEGAATNVTVEALNAKNQLATGFRGNVQITLANSDPMASVPASFSFSAADKGKHTIHMTFETPGTQTVIATSGSLAAQAPVTVGSVVTHFAVYAVSNATAGYPVYVQVVALDANNNVAADYRGTVHFTSTDVFGAQLDDYTFQPGDNGSHTFAISFNSVGEQTLTVTDAANHAIFGAVSVNVSPSVGLWSPWLNSYFGGLGYGYGYGWY